MRGLVLSIVAGVVALVWLQVIIVAHIKTYYIPGEGLADPGCHSTSPAAARATVPPSTISDAGIGLPPATGLPSDAWRPLIYSRCLEGMPLGYAPCLPYENLLVGEELVYPDFRIRFPRFANQEHDKVLRKFSYIRFRHDGEWVYYLNQHGRNLVFANTSYLDAPSTQWADPGCMCGSTPTPHSQFAESKPLTGEVHDEVMFAASPEAWSYQHFLDRTARMLVQTQHLRKHTTTYIVQKPRSAHTQQVLDHLVGTNQPKYVYTGSEIKARRFLYACDTPLMHPYLFERTTDIVMSAAGIDTKPKPWQDRKVVLVLLRSDVGTRRWLNYESECKPKLQGLLETRGQGEVLEEWSPSKHPTIASLITYWQAHVRGVLGVHGGAFYNLQWLTRNSSVVIEIWPVSTDKKATRANIYFQDLSHIRGVSHWNMYGVAESTGNWDVTVDCDLLVRTLDQALVGDYPPTVEPFYQGVSWSYLGEATKIAK